MKRVDSVKAKLSTNFSYTSSKGTLWSVKEINLGQIMGSAMLLYLLGRVLLEVTQAENIIGS
jgi:hypothetical protein